VLERGGKLVVIHTGQVANADNRALRQRANGW
jgi:hypothetical protein